MTEGRAARTTWPPSPAPMPACGLSGVFPPLALIFFFFFLSSPRAWNSTFPAAAFFHQTGVAPAGSSRSWLRQQTHSEPRCHKSIGIALTRRLLPRSGALGLCRPHARAGTEHTEQYTVFPHLPAPLNDDEQKCSGPRKSFPKPRRLRSCYLWYHHAPQMECKRIKRTINTVAHPAVLVPL